MFNFKKRTQGKKGFTIVELVIVIAVIGILAAVLIPTFTSLIAKANLNSDMQAVRQMNVALANSEELYGKPGDIDAAMQVIANAGYETDYWSCLTTGYQVYWYKDDNQCVLYNTTTTQVEYPTDFDSSLLIGEDSSEKFFIYNQTYKNALNQDIGLGSNSARPNPPALDSSNATAGTVDKVVFDSVIGAGANPDIKSSLGISDTDKVYINASDDKKVSIGVGGSSATLTTAQVGNDDELDLSSSGDIVPNMYYISTDIKAGASLADRNKVAEQVGDFVYSLFVQSNMADDKQSADKKVTVLLEPGTVMKVDNKEWRAIQTFQGYFGSTDAENPVIIDGLRLTEATGHAQTISFPGSNSKYFLTGFIGSVYGESTIENIIFRNMTIQSPGSDYDSSVEGNSRNTVGIIGGVYTTPNTKNTTVDVTIRNIVVEESCSITGEASVGGLVGYIGGTGLANEQTVALEGTVLIENCEVHCDVESLDTKSAKGYSPVGGIVGFTCRVGADSDIQIKDCIFTGEAKGYQAIGGVLGHLITGHVNITGCDVSAATLTRKSNEALNFSPTEWYGQVLGYIGKATTSITDDEGERLSQSFNESGNIVKEGDGVLPNIGSKT